MNTPIGYSCLFAFLLIFISSALFLFFPYLFLHQSSHFELVSLYGNPMNYDGYIYKSLSYIDIMVPTVYNNLECISPFQLQHNYLQNKHRLTHLHVFRFTYAALMVTCCFFYFAMTGNNISVIALSVGGNGPPINST